MRPELDKGYQVEDLNIYHIIAIILREHLDSCTLTNVARLCLINKTFAEVLPKIAQWRLLDFSPLREPCLNYEAQTSIDPH